MEKALATLLPIRRITTDTIAGRMISPMMKSRLKPFFFEASIYDIPIAKPIMIAATNPKIAELIEIVLSVVVANIDSSIFVLL